MTYYSPERSPQSSSSTPHTANSRVHTTRATGSSTSKPRASSPVQPELSERVFMNGLLKHTGIALALIVPLAAITAYATPTGMDTGIDHDVNQRTANTGTQLNPSILSVTPEDILYKSATTPTTVDSVDLIQYKGKWYEIGRLPMFFQRHCAGDVTATYDIVPDSNKVSVVNECVTDEGEPMRSDGVAMPTDASASKLKVTFLPKWIRWLPVGRGDYWVLARDEAYQTALVGTPNKKNLWLLARSPNVSQQTYSKYRQIAQQQGFDLKEFTLTPQTGQRVNLVP